METKFFGLCIKITKGFQTKFAYKKTRSSENQNEGFQTTLLYDLVCPDRIAALTLDTANDLIPMIGAWFDRAKGSFNGYNPIG